MAWIRTIGIEEAEGRLAAHYEGAIERAGRVFHIVRLMSLDVDTLRASLGLYHATTIQAEAPLPRWFRELIAVRVSKLNDCFY